MTETYCTAWTFKAYTVYDAHENSSLNKCKRRVHRVQNLLSAADTIHSSNHECLLKFV